MIRYMLNHISCDSLKGQILLSRLYGITPDISIIMMHTFTNQFIMHHTISPVHPQVKKNMIFGLGLVSM